jgi:aspartyl-tRNA synthetase
MIKFAASISKESVVDIEGVVSLPEKPIEATTQKVCLRQVFVSFVISSSLRRCS